MPIYKQSAVTSKDGINFVRTVIEGAGSLFLKIEQESDLGIDALIEFIRDERPLNKQIAVQIKSGSSYYDPASEECAFPIGDHLSYWSSHPLPVFGIVYVPSLKSAFWININRYLEFSSESKSIRFAATRANRLDQTSFGVLFMPAVLGETPALSFEEAVLLANSDRPSEMYLGLLVLFRRYPNDHAFWERLLSLIRSLSPEEIPPVWIYWLAHIPGHGDIAYYGETPGPEVRAYVRGQLASFGHDEAVKLLRIIDPESGIGRGTIGQSVEAIVSSLPDHAALMRRVVRSEELEEEVREAAALILAINESTDALPDILALEKAGSWYAGEIARQIREYGGVNPYG